MTTKSQHVPSVGPIRPYAGIGNIEGYLNDAQVFVKSKGKWISEEDVSLETGDIDKPDLRVKVDLSSQTSVSALSDLLEQMNYSLSEIFLYILVRHRHIKRASTVYSDSLQKVFSTGNSVEVKIELQGDVVLTQHSKVNIELYLLLARDMQGNAPFPSAKGTWLSRKSFNLEFKNQGNFTFKWLPLTLDERRARNLGKDSFLYTEILFSMDQKEALSECIQAYVDQEFLSGVNGGIDRVYGEIIWADLTGKVLTTALTHTMTILSQRRTSWSEVDSKSILYQLIEKISQSVNFLARSRDSQEIYESLLSEPHEAWGLIESLIGYAPKARSFASRIS